MAMQSWIRRLLVLTALAALICAGRYASRKTRITDPEPMVSVGGLTMGGTWSVKLVRLQSSIASPKDLEFAIASVLNRLESQMSIYQPDSTLSQFNASKSTDWIDVPSELADVVQSALRAGAVSDGAFDVTVAPLVNLWGFGPARSGGQVGKIPSDIEIADARKHVGMEKLQCRQSPPALRKSDPEVSVDLGGIGKGFAADRVSVYLNSIGATDYLIAVGGELRARGSAKKQGGWKVGIETPTADTRRIFQQIDLRDASLSTSGNYRNFFAIDGRQYCHEIDPHTGRPIVDQTLASVSVVNASGAEADAMATALIVLGPERGWQLANQLDLAALFILRAEDHFQTRKTPRFVLLDSQRSNEN